MKALIAIRESCGSGSEVAVYWQWRAYVQTPNGVLMVEPQCPHIADSPVPRSFYDAGIVVPKDTTNEHYERRRIVKEKLLRTHESMPGFMACVEDAMKTVKSLGATEISKVVNVNGETKCSEIAAEFIRRVELIRNAG